jgi:hypothetical protein
LIVINVRQGVVSPTMIFQGASIIPDLLAGLCFNLKIKDKASLWKC